MVHVIGMKIIDAIKMNVAAELGWRFENQHLYYVLLIYFIKEELYFLTKNQ